jgi:hypothetical protein
VDDTDRAGNILERIRDHIKKAPPRKERVDLNQAINDVIALAQDEILGRIAQRRHEPSRGRAKELVIVNDRDEWRFRHTASGSSPERISSRPLMSSHYLGHRIPPGNIRGSKLWFTRCPLAENRAIG